MNTFLALVLASVIAWEEVPVDLAKLSALDKGAIEFASEMMADSTKDVWHPDLPMPEGVSRISAIQYRQNFYGLFEADQATSVAFEQYLDALTANGWSFQENVDFNFYGVQQYSAQATKDRCQVDCWTMSGTSEVSVYLKCQLDDEPLNAASDLSVVLDRRMQEVDLTYRALPTYQDDATCTYYWLAKSGDVTTKDSGASTIRYAYANPDRLSIGRKQGTKTPIELVHFVSGPAICFGQSGLNDVYYFNDVREILDRVGAMNAFIPELLLGLVSPTDRVLKEVSSIQEVSIQAFPMTQITGHGRDGLPIRLWIGSDDRLIRRIEYYTLIQEGITVTVFDYHPDTTGNIDPAKLRFHEKGEYPDPAPRSWVRWMWEATTEAIGFF